MDLKCKSCSNVNRGNPQYCRDCGASLSDSVPAWLRWIVKVLSLGKGLLLAYNSSDFIKGDLCTGMFP